MTTRLAGLQPEHDRRIAHSHARCGTLGLSRIERPDFAPLGRADLTLARERHQRLLVHATPVMEMLFEQIAGTESMVVLCDASGTIVHAIGDDDFLGRASKVALRPGVNWSEPAKGTNAIGTALVDERPTLVHADEHFMHANQFLTCSAAPILDPRGNVLGALDVTGDHRSYHQHTMALVNMSARMIENQWLSGDFRSAMRLHFHARGPFIGTLVEGIVAVAPDGRIVGANRSALDQLGLSGAALRRCNVSSLFGTTVGSLIDHFRSPLTAPMAVRTPDGRQLQLVAHVSWPAMRRIDEAETGVPLMPPSPAPAAQPAPVQGLEAGHGSDPALQALQQRLRSVCDRDIPVLLHGEAGTGRRRLARALHAASRGAAGTFVVVHCGALDRADTRTIPVALQRARGGSLLLDAVDGLTASHQAQLLTALGKLVGDAAPMNLIMTSHAPLDHGTDAGRLDTALFYRLQGLSLRVPPLRERSDLATLAAEMLADARPGGVRGGAPRLAAPTLARLAAHHWPGNLRELKTVLHQACTAAGEAATLEPSHLPEGFGRDQTCGPTGPGVAPVPSSPAPLSLGEMEHQAIAQAVAAAGGNITQAARQLGISRNTVYRRLKQGG